MAPKLSKVSYQDNAQSATITSVSDTQIQFSSAMKTTNLTSSQLEKWFANIEKDNKPSKKTDAHLSTQFLSRFGLHNPLEVIAFLKSPEGKITIALVTQELLKIEALNQYKADMYREELLLKQRQLAFLLMALIAKEKAHAKQVSEIIQEQIDEKLKETKPSSSGVTQKTITIQILDANIKAYTNAIMAVDAQLKQLNLNLADVEKELVAIEKEAVQIAEHHDILNDHMAHLNNALQLFMLHNQPIDLYLDHAIQQIALLTSQLEELKAKEVAINTTPGLMPEVESPISRKIRMLEEQIAFYQVQVHQPPANIEHVFQQMLEHVRNRLIENQLIHEDQQQVPHHEHEMEGLRFRERGLHQALQVLRKERTLLNAQLEEVDDICQAHFVIDPRHKGRFQKHGDSFAFCPEDMDPSHMNEEDWVQARNRYHELKSDICVANVQCQQQMQQRMQSHVARKQRQLEVREEFINRIDELEASKVQLLHALSSTRAQKALLMRAPQGKPTSKSGGSKDETTAPEQCPIPRPNPQQSSSYSLMLHSLEDLVPTKAPAPHKEEILDVCSKLEAIVPDERKDELKQLIAEVTPDKIMAPGRRLSWLHRARELVQDIAEPDLDSEFRSSLGFRPQQR